MRVFLLRVALPDRPGALGRVASALGTVDADISAVEIVEKADGFVIDDFMLSVPRGTLPDALVAACTALPDVEVLWLSFYPEAWDLQADVDVLDRMTDDPRHSEQILMDAAPAVFHASWAMVVDRTLPELVSHTPLAPELEPRELRRLGDLTTPRGGRPARGLGRRLGGDHGGRRPVPGLALDRARAQRGAGVPSFRGRPLAAPGRAGRGALTLGQRRSRL